MRSTIEETVLPSPDSEMFERYVNIMPLLSVIEIRTKENGFEGLYYHDEGVIENWSIKRRCAYYIGAVLYYIKTSVLLLKRKKANVALLADSLLNSPRYKKTVEKLVENDAVCGLCNSASCLSAIIDRKDSYEKKKNSIRTVPLGPIIASSKLRSCIKDIFTVFIELQEKQSNCENDDRVEALFERLENEYNKIQKRLVSSLKRFGVNQYITMNEYTVKDVLIIQAGNSIQNFTTKYYNHYCKYVYHTNPPKTNWKMFSKVAYFWDDVDKKYVDEVCGFDMTYSRPEMRVAGSPELDENEIEELVKKNPKKNRITFLIPRSAIFIGVNKPCNEENRRIVFEKKKFLFEQIRTFAENNSCDVVARHNLNDKKEYLDDDMELVLQNGFQLADGEAIKMHKAFCESIAVITDPSSVLFLANVYGCKVYALALSNGITDCCVYEGAHYISKVMDYEIKNIHIESDVAESRIKCGFDMKALLE